MIKNVTTSSFYRRIPSILNWFSLALFLAFVIRRTLFWFSKDALGDRLNFWAFTDWLIDYSSGFTRRGLSGEFINLLSAAAPPRMIVAVLSWLIFLAVVLGYLRMLSSSVNVLNPFTMAGMLSCRRCFFFTFMIMMPSRGRKLWGTRSCFGTLSFLRGLSRHPRDCLSRRRDAEAIFGISCPSH